jgi:hypothetical protein
MAKYTIHDFVKGTFDLTQGYGENVQRYKDLTRNPNTGESTLVNGHEGVDFATPTGTPIYAPFDGIIVRDEINQDGWKNYGVYTVIWDPVQKCALWFCHLKDFTTNIGDQVRVGDVIAHTNNTGNTTGPHVHVNFCETDGNGVRLHQENGSLGFLNLEDTNLVEIIADPNAVIKTFQQLRVEIPGPLPIPTPLPPLPTQPNYEQLFNDKRVECDTNWNSFTSVLAKLGIVADPEDKTGTVGKAEEAIDNLLTTKANLQARVNEHVDSKQKLLDEVAQLKQDYADLAKHNAALQEKDSASVQEGVKAIEENKNLSAVADIATNSVGAKKKTPGAFASAFSAFIASYERKIQEVKTKAQQVSQTPTNNPVKAKMNNWFTQLFS